MELNVQVAKLLGTDPCQNLEELVKLMITEFKSNREEVK